MSTIVLNSGICSTGRNKLESVIENSEKNDGKFDEFKKNLGAL